jgi:hypothetical protein
MTNGGEEARHGSNKFNEASDGWRQEREFIFPQFHTRKGMGLHQGNEK